MAVCQPSALTHVCPRREKSYSPSQRALSNIAIPFANHRASFLLDSDTASNAMEGQEGLDAQMSGWSTRGKRQKSTTSASQVLVETFREVHTSSAQNSPERTFESSPLRAP
ncbi:hypothetical protein H4Q26_012843 [Puccinia striiformis f. sp. tritici PST-130]|nr:hypothetical protein H4Q26_012843 [Puccinia striiformis f. sp. tritici PST-130]